MRIRTLPSPSTLLALAAFAVLGFFSSASPGLYDAGGIVAAAAQLAGSHPPGQPLHAIAAHAAVLIPLGPIPFRVALFSAATEALAAWFVGRLAFELTLERDEPESAPRAELAALAATSAALLSPPLLRQATRPEVYGLAAALAFASMLELMRWWRRSDRSALTRGALLGGLAAAVHPPHALAAVLTGAALLPSAVRARAVGARSIALAALAFVMGFMPYVLLPLRHDAGVLQWGDAGDWPSFVRYATGAAYHGNLGVDETTSAPALVGGVLAYALPIVALPLLAALIGALAARRARVRRGLVLPVLAVMVAMLVPGMLQPLDPRIPDHLAYLAPFVAITVAAGAAAVARSPLDARTRGAALLALAISPHTLLEAGDAVDVDSPVLETLAFSLIDAPPPRALALVTSDLATMSWRSARATEGARPDVGVLPTGTIGEAWQWRPLATHPCFETQPGERSIRAALTLARGCAPVVSEKRDPALQAVALRGLYLAEQASVGLPFVERVDAALGNELAVSPPGASDELASQARNQLLNRADRLAEIGRTDEALRLLGAVLHFLPDPLRAPLARAHGTRPLRAAIAWARDPDALFDASREDAVRMGAELLFRVGRPEHAEALLLDQLERGEPRALVQIARHARAAGDAPTEARALHVLRSIAPDLADEAVSPL